ncbi:MAG: hypothetical protein HDT39_05840 [Lachnospiraceae bacterium]|nr:hypothetical protein [Lachnospiraceae bacterium]
MRFIVLIIIFLVIEEVFKILLGLLNIKVSLINVFKTKDGDIQKYGYSKVLKILFLVFSCIAILDCAALVFLYRKDIPDIINEIRKEDFILCMIVLLMTLFTIYIGFAIFFMGCILKKDELIIRKMFGVQRIYYDEIRKNAKRCKPVLRKRRLYILSEHRIVRIPVISLHEGLGFTNELMKRCGLDVFEEWKYIAVIHQGRDIYEGQYIKMKEVNRKRR